MVFPQGRKSTNKHVVESKEKFPVTVQAEDIVVPWFATILLSKWWNQLLTPVMLFGGKSLNSAVCLLRSCEVASLLPLWYSSVSKWGIQWRQTFWHSKVYVICKALHPIPSSNCWFLVIFDVCISFLFFYVLCNDVVNC